jgi:hypothetical protein
MSRHPHEPQPDLSPPHPKRWDEKYHILIGTGLTTAVIFAVVIAVGVFIPMTPTDPVAYSRLGLDEASRQFHRTHYVVPFKKEASR